MIKQGKGIATREHLEVSCLDVMRCWCPPRRVGRCECAGDVMTYRKSGFGPPQTKLVSTIATRSHIAHMQRFAGRVYGRGWVAARLRCGLKWLVTCPRITRGVRRRVRAAARVPRSIIILIQTNRNICIVLIGVYQAWATIRSGYNWILHCNYIVARTRSQRRTHRPIAQR